ncbi:hypothetical protein H5410_047937 [Solanum commersonii]|uniref:Uncharacterized protein n=1 Tax=Solanum commersonii TaxID=4109 RepID=A0A9J5XIU9_SOLCO|nr:hypothetical protein H5410_047937 [Solanum commersonii]
MDALGNEYVTYLVPYSHKNQQLWSNLMSMTPDKILLLRSKKVSNEALPILEGIDPLKLFPLRLKFTRLGNEVKSR